MEKSLKCRIILCFMTREELRVALKDVPAQPGVYQFRDSRNKPIYIGKAHLLHQRLKSYLKPIDTRISAMVQEATSLSFSPCGSDIESLILESQLIKNRRPKYNVRMRDDKRYAHIAITKEDFPRIYITHQPNGLDRRGNRKTKGIEYIGPFTEGSAIRSTLKYLRSIFPFCTCTQLHNNRCLNAHIGKCLGFCCLKDAQPIEEAKKEYTDNIRAIKGILSGKKKSIIKDIEKEMIKEAEKDNFHKAIEMRTTIERVNRVFENARIIRKSYDSAYALNELAILLDIKSPIKRIEGYDISNIQGQMAGGSMIVFENGVANSDEYRLFNIRTVKGTNDTEMLKEVLIRRFRHPEWPYPDLIVIDGGRGQLNAALSVIPGEIKTISLTKDKKHVGSHILVSGSKNPLRLADISGAVKNLILSVDSEAHRFAIKHYRKKHRKRMVGMFRGF